jgi:glycosyltransferase involved in cell wall biosynthesis
MINPDLNTQPTPPFWYDVSDLMDWGLPYLTGIQRTIVFMLNGFHELGIQPQLVRFNPDLFRFEIVELSDLPIFVRRYLTQTMDAAANEDDYNVKHTRVRKRDRIRHRAQQDPLSNAAYTSLLDVIRASRALKTHTVNWLLAKFRVSDQAPAGNNAPCSFPAPAQSDAHGTPAILISLSASWGIQRHNEALFSLKEQGFFIVRMIYDMIPSLKPHYVTHQEHVEFDTWVREVFWHSGLILAISEYTKKEIHRYCTLHQITPPEVRVVRLGDVLEVSKISASTDENSNRRVAQPAFIPKRPFFIFVCTFHVRKNQRLAYDAWKVMLEKNPEQCPDLVFIGLPHPIVANLIDEIRRDTDVQGRIHLLADVSDHDLQWYYQHCLATIYPSYYEGWGLPVAESLAYGKVCIASHATSIPEISDLTEFIDPYNVYELINNVQRCVNDSAWLNQKETLIRETFVPTEWRTTCQQTLNYLNHDLLTRT